MTIEEVAERLGASVRHVRRLVHERRIPFIKWGHLLRFDPDDIEAWSSDAVARRHPAARSLSLSRRRRSESGRRASTTPAGGQPPETEQRLADRIGSAPLHCRRDVAVQVQEQHWVCMAESFGGDLRRDALVEHERGAGVSEAVGGQPRQAGLDRDRSASVFDMSCGWYEPPLQLREDVVGCARSQRAAGLEALLLSLSTQHARRARRRDRRSGVT